MTQEINQSDAQDAGRLTGGTVRLHMHNARAYARPLLLERESLKRDLTYRERVDMMAAQGEALRMELFECASAIVAAIRENTDETRPV